MYTFSHKQKPHIQVAGSIIVEHNEVLYIIMLNFCSAGSDCTMAKDDHRVKLWVVNFNNFPLKNLAIIFVPLLKV